MTFKEYAAKAREILKAIENKDYVEEVDAPNFVEMHEHNGRVVLVVRDCDGCTSSNNFGSALYTICGEEFEVECEPFDDDDAVKSPFLDLADDLEDYSDEMEEELEDLLYELREELSSLPGSMDDVDSQAEAYAKACGITNYKVVWYENFNEEEFYSDSDNAEC